MALSRDFCLRIGTIVVAVFGSQYAAPRFHQFVTLLQFVTSVIGLLGLVTDDVPPLQRWGEAIPV